MSDSKQKALNAEFEAILSETESSASENIVKCTLQNHLQRLFIRRCMKWLLVLVTLCSAVYYIPSLNWNASAVGRLALIKFVLPFYNWKYLYNADCLIKTWPTESYQASSKEENYADYNVENCAICETLEKVDRLTNISYDDLQNFYILRDRPVIITDSHAWSPTHRNFDDIFEYFEAMPQLMDSIPCNFLSNVIQTRTEQPKLQRVFRQVKRIYKNTDDDWFLHFRNCEFEAIKATRAIFPVIKRPYYISTHWAPFHSSWILMSHKYEMPAMKKLIVSDLVIVLQLRGEIAVRLKAEANCADFCKSHDFQLKEGESLVFLARAWNFYYQPGSAEAESTVTFIQEIDRY